MNFFSGSAGGVSASLSTLFFFNPLVRMSSDGGTSRISRLFFSFSLSTRTSLSSFPGSLLSSSSAASAEGFLGFSGRGPPMPNLERRELTLWLVVRLMLLAPLLLSMELARVYLCERESLDELGVTYFEGI